MMADAGGLVAYDTAAAERYQDFFGRSIFSGKGLIDVDVFYRVLLGVFEPESVLSHDILEGASCGRALSAMCRWRMASQAEREHILTGCTAGCVGIGKTCRFLSGEKIERAGKGQPAGRTCPLAAF